MNSIMENIIATLIVAVLTTMVGLILPTFGLNPQISVSVILLIFLVLFFSIRKLFFSLKRALTRYLLKETLRISPDADESKRLFRKEIIDQVLHEYPINEAQENNTEIVEFKNQDACEAHIRAAASSAKKVKVLTIRGEKYFVGSRSLLYDLYSAPRRSITIEVLVLSPDAGHITDERSRELEHHSAEEVRKKMRITLDYLRHIAEKNKYFLVKCYNETPNFKILIFDNVMFVSSFASGVPKNDRNVAMLQVTSEKHPLFIGFEKYFDELAKRSFSPDISSSSGGL